MVEVKYVYYKASWLQYEGHFLPEIVGIYSSMQAAIDDSGITNWNWILTELPDKISYNEVTSSDKTYGDTEGIQHMVVLVEEKDTFSLTNTNWMQTYTGRTIDPLHPKPENICIKDIARSLSMICRYNGHTTKFYSVAEHCVLIAIALEMQHMAPKYILRGLLHDAAEAYLCDVVNPVKEQLVGYKEAEMKLEQMIWSKYGLPTDNIDIINRCDKLILYNEARAVLTSPVDNWHVLFYPGLEVEVLALSPHQAERRFLSMFDKYNTEGDK